ncbi:NAD(P)(+) transhydrogenase (AB-specific) [Caballeronia calidae]|uniref:proton-translocating NAD(P)(+) transhydrogenase n=1 Tax=Caballeronia calidae TaxID=1777139 RepID=A0A158EJY6_9BURK|nr:NAD(P)(+) transhydrogenase (AB-specific) [Caballeronia calidae]
MLIGIPAETRANEARVAATPETVKKLVTQGRRVSVQSGAGLPASYIDDVFAQAGADIVDAATAFSAEIVLKVQSPAESELSMLKSGAVLIGMLDPFNTENTARLAAANVTAFALEAAPRTTRAQSLDVLSSQANIDLPSARLGKLREIPSYAAQRSTRVRPAIFFCGR